MATTAVAADAAADDPLVRERATTASAFDPPEVHRGRTSAAPPGIARGVLPLVVVVLVNLVMSLVVLPRLDTGFLAEERWGGIPLVVGERRVVGGRGARRPRSSCSSCSTAGGCRRCARPSTPAPTPRCCRCSASRASSGFGAVVAAMPAFAVVRDWVLVDRRRAARLARGVDQHSRRADRLGVGRPDDRARRARRHLHAARRASSASIPALMHRVAVIGAGTLDSLPHNGAVVTLLAVCGSTHRQELFRHRDRRHRRPDPRAGRGDRARLGVRILLTQPEDVKMLKHVARAGLIAAAVAWGTASAQTTVNYGRITERDARHRGEPRSADRRRDPRRRARRRLGQKPLGRHRRAARRRRRARADSSSDASRPSGRRSSTRSSSTAARP